LAYVKRLSQKGSLFFIRVIHICRELNLFRRYRSMKVAG
jgi:hypothetical protein